MSANEPTPTPAPGPAAEDADVAEVRALRRTAARYRDLLADLGALCDDDWLRRRDRAMRLPGTVLSSADADRDAAGAWESAASLLRTLLEEHGHESDLTDYKAWRVGDRDRGGSPRESSRGR